MKPRKIDENLIRCPDCGYPIKKVRSDDQPEDVHWFVWQCSGCFHEFGPEWRDGEMPTVLYGGEPWVDPSKERETLKLTLGSANRGHITAGTIGVAVISMVLAALSLFVILQQLVEKPFDDMVTTLLTTFV
jgi:hypothetical protein